MAINNDIQDNEIRVIGQSHARPGSAGNGSSGRSKRRKRMWIMLSVLAAAAVVAFGLFWIYRSAGHISVKCDDKEEIMPFEPIGDYASTEESAYTEYVEMAAGEAILDVYIPHNAVPRLSLGNSVLDDENVVLAFQAADVRADNGKIVGAYVLAGEPIAWGLSKKGYCAIIDGEITVGMADNSPLFEEATEKGGYFFRQYALVCNGQPVENTITSASFRKALCSRGAEIFVAVGKTPLTFHDFSQALIEIGVDNAIYLMGGGSYGFYRGKDGIKKDTGRPYRSPYKYENYIVWGE